MDAPGERLIRKLALIGAATNGVALLVLLLANTATVRTCGLALLSVVLLAFSMLERSVVAAVAAALACLALFCVAAAALAYCTASTTSLASAVASGACPYAYLSSVGAGAAWDSVLLALSAIGTASAITLLVVRIVVARKRRNASDT